MAGPLLRVRDRIPELCPAGHCRCDIPCGRRLLQHASARFEETTEDMQNYALKHDGIRRGLVNDEEADAYIRAIVHMIGERAVCAPWREDFEIRPSNPR